MGDGYAKIGGYGLADIGKRRAQAESGGADLWTEGQQGNEFARVIGAGDGGIATVIGREDGKVPFA